METTEIVSLIVSFIALIVSIIALIIATKELKETRQNNIIVGNIRIKEIELNIISFLLDIFEKNRNDATNPQNRSETTIGKIMNSDAFEKYDENEVVEALLSLKSKGVISIAKEINVVTKDENNDIRAVIGEDGKPQKIDQRSKQLKEWILCINLTDGPVEWYKIVEKSNH